MDKIEFERKAIEKGNAVAVNLPPELVKFLDIKLGGTLKLSAGRSKGRKYLKVYIGDE